LILVAGKFIGASEVGEFAYCRRSWKLASSGVERTNGRDRREQGNDWHREQGRKVQYSGRLRVLAIAVLLLGVLLIVAAVAVSNFGFGQGVF
jgi:hypothetical protein